MPSDTIAVYGDANQRRIFDACPHASEVRTFHGWLAAGRVVMKGQKGIRLVSPDTIDASGKARSIKAGLCGRRDADPRAHDTRRRLAAPDWSGAIPGQSSPRHAQ